jgi:hypothetical protein
LCRANSIFEHTGNFLVINKPYKVHFVFGILWA